MVVDSEIIKFIKRHHVLTLATVGDVLPHCSNLFYAWSEVEQCFVFTSPQTSRHAKDALTRESVAGSIVLETKIVGKIQGVQLQGDMTLCSLEDEVLQEEIKSVYLKKYPYAVAMSPLELWVLRPTFLKFTNNVLGFGKKLICGEERF